VLIALILRARTHRVLMATTSHGLAPTAKLKIAFSDFAALQKTTYVGEASEWRTLSTASASSTCKRTMWLLYVRRSKTTSRPCQSFAQKTTSLLLNELRTPIITHHRQDAVQHNRLDAGAVKKVSAVMRSHTAIYGMHGYENPI
jgi:hypothetical protein